MLLFKILFYLFCLSSIFVSQAITLDDYVEKALTTHPLFVKESLTLESAKHYEQSLKGSKDWQFGITPSLTNAEEIVFVNVQPDEFSSKGINTTLSKSFWSTGGQLSLSLNSAQNEINIPASGKFKYHQNELTATYAHPLLKNSGGQANQYQYKISQLNTQITALSVSDIKEAAYLQLHHRFFDWYATHQEFLILQNRLDLAQQQLMEIERKHSDNIVDKIEVLRAEDAVYRSEQGVFQSHAQLVSIKNELGLIINDPDFDLEEPFYNNQLLELEIPGFELAKLRAVNRVYKAQKQNMIAYNYFKNQSHLQLDLFISGGLKNQDTSFKKSLEADTKKNYAVGFNVSTPIGNTMFDQLLKQNQSEKNKLIKELEELELNLNSQVNTLVNQLIALKEVLLLNQKQIDLAKEKTREEEMLFNQGRGQLNFVILAQDNEQNLELQYIRTLITYNKIFYSYLNLIDKLL